MQALNTWRKGFRPTQAPLQAGWCRWRGNGQWVRICVSRDAARLKIVLAKFRRSRRWGESVILQAGIHPDQRRDDEEIADAAAEVLDGLGEEREFAAGE